MDPLAVSLDLFKTHVRADDFSEDDDYLDYLLRVAQEHILRATNRTLSELTAMGGGVVPADIVHAIMLLAGHLYDNRAAVGSSGLAEIPYTLTSLYLPYRKLV